MKLKGWIRMSVKVNIEKDKVKYKEGCLVKHSVNGWYGILVVTDVAKGTYNVLRFDEEDRDCAYLYYSNSNVSLSDIQMYFNVVTDEKGYDLTLTLKGDN